MVLVLALTTDWSMGYFFCVCVINVVGAKDNEFKFAIALCFRVIKLACLKSTKCWHIFFMNLILLQDITIICVGIGFGYWKLSKKEKNKIGNKFQMGLKVDDRN